MVSAWYPCRRDRLPTPVFLGFPGGSAGNESACNVGDLGLIPGLGRSPGEGKATYSSILAWRIPWTIQSMGSQSQTRLSDFHFTQYLYGIDWFQDLQDTKICGFSYFIKNGTVFVDNLHICSHRL